MNNEKVLRSLGELDGLFDQTDALLKTRGSFLEDDELQAHWVRYLCIRVSGFLENALRHIYVDYARSNATKYVSNYVERQLERMPNPMMDRICGLTKAFNPQWESELRNTTELEVKESINSIIRNRNKIAHGESVNLTYTDIRRWYKNAVSVLRLIDDQCVR